jgi:hypothetical protein
MSDPENQTTPPLAAPAEPPVVRDHVGQSSKAVPPVEPPPEVVEPAVGAAGTGAAEEASGAKPRTDREYRQGRSSEPEILPKTLNATQAVFVPWQELEGRIGEVLRSASSTRVVVVAGARGSGRFTAAVWLALRFQPQTIRPRVVVPSEAPSSGSDLVGWVRSSDRQEETVYILRDPLSKESLREWFVEDRLNSINNRLEGLQSWLILTVGDAGADAILASPEVKTVEVPPATAPLLKETLTRLWRWMSENEPGWGLGEPKGRLWDGVYAVIGDAGFTRVPQVVRFLWRLPQWVARGLPPEPAALEAALRALAHLVAGDVTQAWFAGLSPNARFLALLVEALSGLQRSEIERIYCDEALKLSASRGLISDPRRHSFDDLYREINVQVVSRLVERDFRQANRKGGAREKLEIQYLEFAEGSYREEVRRQMRGRHHLLWDVLVSLGSTQLDRLLGPAQWEERQAFGEAIARFGGHRLDDLRVVMDGMGRDDSGIVSSIPGYVMRGLCLLPDPNLDFVQRLLGDWARTPALSWACVAAIWRVHAAAQRRLIESSPAGALHAEILEFMAQIEAILTGVAGTYLDQNPPDEDHDHVAYAAGKMFQAAPARTVALLRRWLFGEGSLNKAGWRATRLILTEHSDGGRLSEVGFDEFLGLVEPLLFLEVDFDAQKQVVDELLERLEGWIEYQESQVDRGRTGSAWAVRIEAALLGACNRARDGERHRIRRALVGEWLRSINPRVRAIAQRVVTRARLLEGAPVELPGHRGAALLVDSSPAGSVNHTSDRLLVELAEYLHPQVDLDVGHLGNGELMAERGGHVDYDLLPSRQGSPRILMPWVEKLERESPDHHFILIVHWAEVVDIADADRRGRIPLHCLPAPVVHESDHGPELREAVKAAVALGHQPLVDLFQVLAHHRKVEVRENNRARSEWMFQWVGFCVDASLSQVLAARTGVEWGQAIARALPELARASEGDPDRMSLLGESLEGLIARVEAGGVDATVAGRDPLRMALVLVQAMAVEDLSGTVDRLCRWMASDERDLRGNFAMAAGIMLLRIHFARMVPSRAGAVNSVPTAEGYHALLRLGPSLAGRQSESGTGVLLLAIRCWLGDPAWARRVLEGPEMTKTADAMGPQLRAEAIRQVGQLASGPIPAVGEEKPPALALAWASRFRFCLASEPTVLSQPLTKILVIVHSSQDPGSRGRLGRIAWKIHSRCEQLEGRGQGLGAVAFIRAGCRHPFAVSHEGVGREVEARFAAGDVGLGIVGPLLERFGPGSDLVVVLADGPLCDAEDVIGTSNSAVSGVGMSERRYELFWDNGRLSPPTVTPAWTRFLPTESEDQAVETLWNRLVTLVKCAMP